jgi:hypothetical protein
MLYSKNKSLKLHRKYDILIQVRKLNSQLEKQIREQNEYFSVIHLFYAK